MFKTSSPFTLAESFIGNFNLSVHFGGSLARSIPGEIFIPSFNNESLLERQLTCALMVHELAHTLFSDYGASKIAKDDITFKLCNVLEDLRVEKELMDFDADTKPHLKHLNNYLWKSLEPQRFNLHSFDRLGLLSAYMLIHGQFYHSHFRGLELLDCNLEDCLRNYMDNATFSLVQNHTESLMYAQSSADAFELGLDIKAKLDANNFFYCGAESALYDRSNLETFTSPYCQRPDFKEKGTRLPRLDLYTKIFRSVSCSLPPQQKNALLMHYFMTHRGEYNDLSHDKSRLAEKIRRQWAFFSSQYRAADLNNTSLKHVVYDRTYGVKDFLIKGERAFVANSCLSQDTLNGSPFGKAMLSACNASLEDLKRQIDSIENGFETNQFFCQSQDELLEQAIKFITSDDEDTREAPAPNAAITDTSKQTASTYDAINADGATALASATKSTSSAVAANANVVDIADAADTADTADASNVAEAADAADTADASNITEAADAADAADAVSAANAYDANQGFVHADYTFENTKQCLPVLGKSSTDVSNVRTFDDYKNPNYHEPEFFIEYIELPDEYESDDTDSIAPDKPNFTQKLNSSFTYVWDKVGAYAYNLGNMLGYKTRSYKQDLYICNLEGYGRNPAINRISSFGTLDRFGVFEPNHSEERLTAKLAREADLRQQQITRHCHYLYALDNYFSEAYVQTALSVDLCELANSFGPLWKNNYREISVEDKTQLFYLDSDFSEYNERFIFIYRNIIGQMKKFHCAASNMGRMYYTYDDYRYACLAYEIYAHPLNPCLSATRTVARHFYYYDDRAYPTYDYIDTKSAKYQQMLSKAQEQAAFLLSLNEKALKRRQEALRKNHLKAARHHHQEQRALTNNTKALSVTNMWEDLYQNYFPETNARYNTEGAPLEHFYTSTKPAHHQDQVVNTLSENQSADNATPCSDPTLADTYVNNIDDSAIANTDIDATSQILDLENSSEHVLNSEPELVTEPVALIDSSAIAHSMMASSHLNADALDYMGTNGGGSSTSYVATVFNAFDAPDLEGMDAQFDALDIARDFTPHMAAGPWSNSTDDGAAIVMNDNNVIARAYAPDAFADNVADECSFTEYEPEYESEIVPVSSINSSDDMISSAQTLAPTTEVLSSARAYMTHMSSCQAESDIDRRSYLAVLSKINKAAPLYRTELTSLMYAQGICPIMQDRKYRIKAANLRSSDKLLSSFLGRKVVNKELSAGSNNLVNNKDQHTSNIDTVLMHLPDSLFLSPKEQQKVADLLTHTIFKAQENFNQNSMAKLNRAFDDSYKNIKAPQHYEDPNLSSYAYLGSDLDLINDQELIAMYFKRDTMLIDYITNAPLRILNCQLMKELLHDAIMQKKALSENQSVQNRKLEVKFLKRLIILLRGRINSMLALTWMKEQNASEVEAQAPHANESGIEEPTNSSYETLPKEEYGLASEQAKPQLCSVIPYSERKYESVSKLISAKEAQSQEPNASSYNNAQNFSAKQDSFSSTRYSSMKMQETSSSQHDAATKAQSMTQTPYSRNEYSMSQETASRNAQGSHQERDSRQEIASRDAHGSRQERDSRNGQDSRQERDTRIGQDSRHERSSRKSYGYRKARNVGKSYSSRQERMSRDDNDSLFEPNNADSQSYAQKRSYGYKKPNAQGYPYNRAYKRSNKVNDY